jgi:integrase
VKSTVDAWTDAANITHGTVFRAINKARRVWGDGMSPKVLWDVVRVAAARAGIAKLAPHDLRRTCGSVTWLAANWIRSIPAGARLDPDDGALPWMQAAIVRAPLGN